MQNKLDPVTLETNEYRFGFVWTFSLALSLSLLRLTQRNNKERDAY